MKTNKIGEIASGVLSVEAYSEMQTRQCHHGKPKSQRCEQCVNEGVYTYAQPKKSGRTAQEEESRKVNNARAQGY